MATIVIPPPGDKDLAIMLTQQILLGRSGGPLKLADLDEAIDIYLHAYQKTVERKQEANKEASKPTWPE